MLRVRRAGSHAGGGAAAGAACLPRLFVDGVAGSAAGVGESTSASARPFFAADVSVGCVAIKLLGLLLRPLGSGASRGIFIGGLAAVAATAEDGAFGAVDREASAGRAGVGLTAGSDGCSRYFVTCDRG